MLDLVHTDHPDEKSVMTYVSSLYEVFPKEPTVQEALHDNVSVYIGNKQVDHKNFLFQPLIPFQWLISYAKELKIIKLYMNCCNLELVLFSHFKFQ